MEAIAGRPGRRSGAALHPAAGGRPRRQAPAEQGVRPAAAGTRLCGLAGSPARWSAATRAAASGWAQDDRLGGGDALPAEAAAQGLPAMDRPGMPGSHDGFRLPRRDGGGGEPKGKPAVTAGALSGDLSVLVGALACVAPVASRPAPCSSESALPSGGAGHPAGTARQPPAADRGHRRLAAPSPRASGPRVMRVRIILLLELASSSAASGSRGASIACGQAGGRMVRGPAADDRYWYRAAHRPAPLPSALADTRPGRDRGDRLGALRYPGLPAHLSSPGLVTRCPKLPSASWWMPSSCRWFCGPGSC